jgi:hypothetical protein
LGALESLIEYSQALLGRSDGNAPPEQAFSTKHQLKSGKEGAALEGRPYVYAA